MDETNQATDVIKTMDPDLTGTELVIPVNSELVASAPSPRQLRIQANKLSIVQAMVSAGIAKAIVTYNGAGDEGSIQHISTEGGQILADEVKVEMVQEKATWNAEKQLWEHDTELVTDALTDALRSFVDDVVEEHHDGYANGEGGGGEISITSDTGKIDYEKFDYIVERTCDYLAI